jgi:hypothetical protein
MEKKLNWVFPNMKNYVEKTKRVFREIGLKEILYTYIPMTH